MWAQHYQAPQVHCAVVKMSKQTTCDRDIHMVWRHQCAELEAWQEAGAQQARAVTESHRPLWLQLR